MNEEIVNHIKAEIEALHIEVRELKQEIKELKNKDAFDISEEDPMELLDSIDAAAEGKENDILSEAFTRWKENVESAKIITKAPKVWTKDFGMLDDSYYK
jgi:hypothetical protein